MVLENYDVDNVLMPDVTSNTMTFSSLLDAIESSSASVAVVSAGDTFSAGTLKMTILSPIGSSYDGGNEWSIVLKASFGKISMLFTGDVEETNEYELLNKYGKTVLSSDYLKVGHHGSSTSSREEFISAVSPKIASISCGTGNSYGHPQRPQLWMFLKSTAHKYTAQMSLEALSLSATAKLLRHGKNSNRYLILQVCTRLRCGFTETGHGK